MEPNPGEIRESPGSVCVWSGISLREREGERTIWAENWALTLTALVLCTAKLTGWRMERIAEFSWLFFV